LCLDGAFVADDVHVATTVINKHHARCVYVRRAGGIIRLVLRHGSSRNDDQGIAGVGVLASASSRLPNIVNDIHI
jgi:hypothetical protein